MKTSTYFFALIILLTGCSKALEEHPRGLVVGSEGLSSQAGLEAALTGAYGSLMVPWESGFTTVSQIAMCMGADDLTTHPGSNKEEFREFDRFNVSSLNSRMTPIWRGCYKVIQSTNNIINNYSAVQDGVEAEVQGIVGEAYFLRALSYYWLTRYWGAVPLVLTEKYTADQLTMQKSEPAAIYKQIEEDLKKAEEWVPNAKRGPLPGRPNKGSVKALLADVYLTEAGWPLKDASKYALAAAKAKEVIDAKGTYKFDLYQEGYLKIFAGGTVEDVFTIFTRGQWSTYNSFYGLSTMPEDEGGWSDFFPELKFFNDFPAGSRKDATFSTVFTAGGNTILWQQTTTKHPYYKKFTIQTGKRDTYMSNNPVVMIRYAHVLLIYAEAQARSAGTPSPEAYAAVNAVRQRAGLGNLPDGLPGPAFADAVVDERAWEFAGEWSRWFDLVRLEQVEAANAGKDPGDLEPGAITKEKYWLPIPGADALVNPNL
jgi:hypothetical protein